MRALRKGATEVTCSIVSPSFFRSIMCRFPMMGKGCGPGGNFTWLLQKCCVFKISRRIRMNSKPTGTRLAQSIAFQQKLNWREDNSSKLLPEALSSNNGTSAPRGVEVEGWAPLLRNVRSDNSPQFYPHKIPTGQYQNALILCSPSYCLMTYVSVFYIGRDVWGHKFSKDNINSVLNFETETSRPYRRHWKL